MTATEDPERRADYRLLPQLRDDLAGVRRELAAKTRTNRRLILALGAVVVVFSVLLAVGIVTVRRAGSTVSKIDARGQENKVLLANMTALLMEVQSVTNPSARAEQDANTRALVAGAVCALAVDLRSVYPTITLPKGCQP